MSDIKTVEVPITDTGIQFLPPHLASAIQADAGARIVKGFQYPIIDCGQSTNQTNLHFGFGGEGGPVIAVPKSELVIPRFDTKGVQLRYNGNAACEFGIWTSTSSTSKGTYTIGDTFLRSAYVVRNPFCKHRSFPKYDPILRKINQNANPKSCR